MLLKDLVRCLLLLLLLLLKVVAAEWASRLWDVWFKQLGCCRGYRLKYYCAEKLD